MIITLVSEFNQAGKSEALKVAPRLNKYGLNIAQFSFAEPTWSACDTFMGWDLGKYDVHPDLGITKKQLNHAISEACLKLHPELSVYRVKQGIVKYLGIGYSVITDDMRRECEFKWADELAERLGTHHHIIEVIPVGKQSKIAVPDTWSNGVEPCGYEVWRYRHRYTVENDGTEKFQDDVVKLIQWLLGMEDAKGNILY